MKQMENRREEVIEKYLKQVIKEAASINIPISKEISHHTKINKRARSRFACCRFLGGSSKHKFQIEIGEMIFQCDEKAIKGILAHEVLHTCDHCNNHGALWKIYANTMNSHYDYNIKRAATYEELGLEKPESNQNRKYKITCTDCGMTFERMKKSKVVSDCQNYRCKCGGKLKCEKL